MTPQDIQEPCSELILHHDGEGPFAEKIRLIFGITGLAWSSAIMPSAMPKPFLMPSTGCYAIKRYVNETNRLADDYSSADMAADPWIVPHQRQGQNPDDTPNLGKKLPFGLTAASVAAP